MIGANLAAVTVVESAVSKFHAVDAQRDQFPNAVSLVQYSSFTGDERAVEHDIVVGIATDPYSIAHDVGRVSFGINDVVEPDFHVLESSGVRMP